MRICLVLLFFYNFCFAQSGITDSVYVIKQIEIQSGKNQFYKKASKNQSLDSSITDLQNFSLADILSRKSPVFVKTTDKAHWLLLRLEVHLPIIQQLCGMVLIYKAL
jgi:hypothetical protein